MAEFLFELSNKKSRFNKIKVGRTVQAKPRLVEWYVTHLCWSYGMQVDSPKSNGYDEKEKELPLDSLRDVYIWVSAKLTGKMPIGLVSHYGANDFSSKLKRGISAKCVWVDFTFKTEFGDHVLGLYVSEKDLVLVKEKKKTKR